MDYQKFIQQLPHLYQSWGEESVRPQSPQFQEILAQVKGLTTVNTMQMLNWAVQCLEPGEIYCEIGCFQGANLIGALLNRPHQTAYAVDNFSELDVRGENFEQLTNNLINFHLEEQVFFYNRNFEEFFCDLRNLNPQIKIGVYFYGGARDYRSQLLGLLLVKPFLAERALIIADDTNWSSVQQANWDFMAAYPQSQLLLDLPTPCNAHHTFWNGLQVFSWDRHQTNGYSWSTLTERFRHQPFIQALHNSNIDFEFNAKVKVIQSLEKQALELHNAQHWNEAEQKWKEILLWDSHHARTYYHLGKTYYQKGQYQDALNMAWKSIKLDASQAEYHYHLGLILEKLGDNWQAVTVYQKAIALNPSLIDAYDRLGILLAIAGSPAQTESVYREAIALNPENHTIYLNLGNFLLQRNDLEKAILIYKTVLKLQPDNQEAIRNLEIADQMKQEGIGNGEFR
jgi:tetratricopeptide (TPR) repeat protein